MRRRFLLSVFILLSAIFSTAKIFADEITLGTVQCVELKNSNFYERTCRLRYDGKYYLQINSSYRTSWIELSETQLEQLRNMMIKFQEWKKIAKDNNTDVTKELPNSEIKAKVSWSDGSNFHTSAYNITIKFSIMTTNNGEKASLVLMSSEVTASDNRYIDFETGTIIFMGDAVDEFQNLLIKENIENAIRADAEKKNTVDSLFN